MLYALYPADKTISYVVFQQPWMLAVTCLLMAPFGVATASWLFLFSCIIGVDDEYQLFNYITSFKTYAFLVGGMLPMFVDYFVFYFRATSGGNSGDPSMYMQVTDWLFLLNWMLCYVAFYRYKRVRKLHYEDGVPRIILTGDADSGDWEPTIAMKYDAVATIAVVVIMLVDFVVRVRPGSDDSATTRNRLWWNFFTVVLSLSAAPFVLFKLPGLGPLVHGLRATGYDQSGNLRLEMSLPHCRAKYESETGVKSRSASSLLSPNTYMPPKVPKLGLFRSSKSTQESASESNNTGKDAAAMV